MSGPEPIPDARSAILETLPEDTSLHGQPAELRFTYVPPSHAKALHPDTQLVVGMRGAGKSFWWGALQRPEHRALIEQLEPRAGIVEAVAITAGFGEEPNPGAYPGRDVLGSLLARKHDPRVVWRTVILNALSGSATDIVGSSADWEARVDHVERTPEAADRLLYEKDSALDRERRHWIILFDALDRSASSWSTMNRLIRGLLEAVLDLRPYRRLRAKCFLRTDQLDEREVATFADASKLLAGRVELTWPSRELYGLLFQHLGNHDGFRQQTAHRIRGKWRILTVRDQSAWLPPERVQRDEACQRDLFHAIAGPWMGRDRRRGYPFRWVPGHLADAVGRTSPRPFLAALRKAAQDSAERYPEHRWPLHYESIKRGVQEASSIRVLELQEDYPWIGRLMEPLRGKVVPCTFDEIASAWEKQGSLGRLAERVEQGVERLPPAHLEEKADGVRRDLEELGIFLRLQDDRVNIPDVFRVGYGLGRRGGVKPIRPGTG